MEFYWFANRNQGTDRPEEIPEETLAKDQNSALQDKRLIVYRNELARTLLSERGTSGTCTAMIWSFPRVKVPPGVKSGQS